ncbi:NAD(P)H-dependent flavin oxidoreductase [Oceanobacillus sp. CAU 1775]
MNELCEILKIRYPIIQGGMGNISNAPLTIAVSEAGGLGTIGVGTMEPLEVEKIIQETKEGTNNPFAVNIPINVTPYLKEMLSLVLKYKVPVVSLSAGNPVPFIKKLQDHDVKVITVCASVKQAKKVADAGADIIVAEGYEAAGINSAFETTTLTLIPQITDQVDVPVVAAGGIADGRGLAAMLMLGASGVQMGTRFIATEESPFHMTYKNQIIQANDHGTTIVGRSVGKIRRILRTPYSEKLLTSEEKGMQPEAFDEMTTEERHKIGALEGSIDEGFMNSGQVAGLISDIIPVKDLLEKTMREANEVIHCYQKLL